MSMSVIMSRALRIFNIWTSGKLILENLASDSYSSKAGKTLSFFKGVYFVAKKLLKCSAFLLKSTSNLFITSGGISGILVPLWNVFKMNQCVLGLVFDNHLYFYILILILLLLHFAV